MRDSYRSESLVVAWRSRPVSFFTLTFAFGTMAPLGSFTKPEIEPKSDCANARLVQIGIVGRGLAFQARFILHADFRFRNDGSAGVFHKTRNRTQIRLCECETRTDRNRWSWPGVPGPFHSSR